MNNLRKKIEIFNKLKNFLESSKINNNNIDIHLNLLDIKKKEFYTCFPKKINDLCFFYFENLYYNSVRKIKKKLSTEKSISKKTNLILSEFIKDFDSKRKLSIYFLSYTLLNPLILSKIVYKISSEIWYDIGDLSTDFNYYSKRLILFNIIKNSLFFWRKTLDQKKTLNFSERQIIFFGRLGKVKYDAKKFFLHRISFNSN